MKLNCSQAELNSALQLVSRAVATRPTHPVLANVLLTADAGTGKILLTGFDLNLGIQTALPAAVETSGAITLPAKLFGEIVSKLSNDFPLTLITDESGEQVELISKSGSYQMRGMLADDFPDLPLVESGTSLQLKPFSLVNALKSTLFASSSDESKQLLTGVNLSFKGSSVESAATDGHRLAVLNLKNALTQDSLNESEIDELTVTLPARSLREVERFVSSCDSNQTISLFSDKGQVVFMSSDQVITTRTLEGTYPNYNQLIPAEFSKTVQFNRKEFIASLERIAVLADQYNNVIKVTNEESESVLKITTDAQDIGSGSESIAIISEGDKIQIAFNVRYLLDGLKVIDAETIKLKCNGPTTPAVFSPLDDDNQFIYLVMPVQMRN